jgi:tetratricopeptide (TPR) repeat protein
MIQLSLQLTAQKAHLHRGNNKFLAGITAHNLGVVKVLAGHDHDENNGDVIAIFQEAIALKESAFGTDHPEVATSWDELGIQYFARGSFEEALGAFREAHKVRNRLMVTDAAATTAAAAASVAHDSTAESSSTASTTTAKAPAAAVAAVADPSVAMVLNNIACCNFQMRNFRTALLTLQEAKDVQTLALAGSSSLADLDILHKATVMSNCGYLSLCLKLYDEARSLFEEALLIQQSVLEDNHRAVRDTLSNLAFTNAFHL